MTFFRLDNKWLIWPLFLFLMGYAILRALFVEPLFDELATLYWYIQTGYVPGHGATMDANNQSTRFNWYFGRKTVYRFHYPNHPFLVMPEDRILHIRFYNDDQHTVNLSGIHVKILAVNKK